MNLGLEGRVAVVGGGSSGLGYAVAERLAAEGARVVIAARSADRIAAAVDRIRDAVGCQVAGVAADLTDAEAPARIFDEATTRFGPVTIVVANAGGPPSMPAVDADDGDLETACRLLLLPVQRLFHGALPAMREVGWGRFVSITSVAVLEPQPGLVLSNALRAAVTGYLKSLADEVAADGITVNSVCPGYTATERLDALAAALADRQGGSVGEIKSGWADHVPMGRLLEPDEVGAAVAFLCSVLASGITGVALPVDGGLHRGLI